jgi:hypothetical protein
MLEAEVFLFDDQESGCRGGGGSGGRVVVVFLSTGERRSGSSAGWSVGLLP